LLNDTPERTAVRTANLAAVSFSRALFHLVSYYLIEHSIGDIGVRLAEVFLFFKLTALRKQKMVVG
jgi:hypothetical protein